MRGGVFVGKSVIKTIYATDFSRYRQLKEAGFSVVYLHEEGAFFSGAESEWDSVMKAQYDVNIFDSEDLVCVWGDLQAEIDRRRRPDYADRIRVTGHPRFDLYKPEWRELYASRARDIRNELGPYLLVNTNVSYANHGLGPLHPFTAAGGYDPREGRAPAHVNQWAFGSVIRARFVSLIHKIADQFPDLTIVLRPHPSEDHEFYSAAIAGVANVVVRHEGPVGPWIIGSDAMLHNGCTTALEAYLAGKPVITYSPVQDPVCEIQIPNLLGTVCRTDAEVADAIARVRSGAKEEVAVPDRVRQVIHNVGHDSFATLHGVIEEAARDQPSAKVPSRSQLRRRHGPSQAVTRTKDWIYARIPSRQRELRYYRTKFYGFDYSSIERKLEAIEKITGKSVRCEPVSEALFTIHAV